MKIALLGYGKMGKAIERIASQRHHEVTLKVTSQNTDFDLNNVDVAIDFSTPSTAVKNITQCFNHQIPIISGTTGWLDHYNDIIALCEEKKGTFLYASNFSIGVNIFFEINAALAKLTKELPQYKVDIEEIHHTQKLDAPSGTAITLADAIIEHSPYERWTLDTPESKNDIEITSKRIENIPGTHTISYKSGVDTIQIQHTAHNREGFALGAVIAAEWIIGKKGVFSMKDVLNITPSE